MTIRFRIAAAAGALAVGVAGAPAPAHAAVTAAPASASPGPADPYRQGVRKGLLDGDDAAEKECAYDNDIDIEGHAPRPAGTPVDPATVAVPPGHGDDWVRGYREGFRRGWTDGLQSYCAHGS